MKLSGKSLEQFEKWYLTYFTDEDLWEHNKKLTDSEKYGVLVDWFDSVGIYINILGNGTHSFEVIINLNYETYGQSRHEARAKAIEKANDLYNKR